MGRDSVEEAYNEFGVTHFFQGSTSRLRVNTLPGVLVVFQYDQPLGNVTTDLDIALLLPDTFDLVAGSFVFNRDIGRAVEIFEVPFIPDVGGNPITQFDIFIQRFPLPDEGPVNKIKLVFFGPVSAEFDIQSDLITASTVYGHANAEEAMAVGAAAHEDTPGFGVSPAIVEEFSSLGGTPILFNIFGERIPEVIRPKPHFTGPDGSCTTFFGSEFLDAACPYRFFGTSASAPNVAAVAALLRELDPDITNGEIKTFLESTAEDMDDPFTPLPNTDPGFDFRTGFGFINASSAADAVVGPTPPKPPGTGSPKIFGDPHFLRFKQTKHDSFQGECDLVFLKNKGFHGGQGLDIHIRTTMKGNTYSYVEATAISIGEHVLEFHSHEFLFNGKEMHYDMLPLSFFQDDKEYILSPKDGNNNNNNNNNNNKKKKKKKKSNTEVVLQLNDHSSITISSSGKKDFMKVQLDMMPADVVTSVGILGDYSTGDMIGRYGQMMENFQDMGFEWQVNPEDPQLFVFPREPQLPYERCRLPTVSNEYLHSESADTESSVSMESRRRHLRAEQPDLYAKAAKACAKAPPDDFDLCLDDVMLTGELDLADEFVL